NAAVPRDLETIVHKAMERDSGQRYQTAADLGADLQRFLNDEPIQARRMSLTERLVRWCRRNPAVASLVATVALVLVLATGIASYFAIRANENAEQAKRHLRNAQKEKQTADNARGDAEKARNTAVRARDDLRENLYYTEMNLASQAAHFPDGL